MVHLERQTQVLTVFTKKAAQGRSTDSSLLGSLSLKTPNKKEELFLVAGIKTWGLRHRCCLLQSIVDYRTHSHLLIGVHFELCDYSTVFM